MVEITVKIKVNGTEDEADKWLRELAENEMFEYNIIKIKQV